MGVLPISHTKDSTFENADALVRYMEFRLGTPRAHVTREHFAQLVYLANRKILMSKQDMAKRGVYVSLRDHDYADLVPLARERIQLGEIPHNWLELFHQHMSNQAEPQATTQEV